MLNMITLINRFGQFSTTKNQYFSPFGETTGIQLEIGGRQSRVEACSRFGSRQARKLGVAKGFGQTTPGGIVASASGELEKRRGIAIQRCEDVDRRNKLAGI